MMQVIRIFGFLLYAMAVIRPSSILRYNIIHYITKLYIISFNPRLVFPGHAGFSSYNIFTIILYPLGIHAHLQVIIHYIYVARLSL